MSTIPTARSFVGGDWLSANGSKTMQKVNPSDVRDVLCEVVLDDVCAVEAAVSAAAAAQPRWATMTGMARGELLYRWADRIAARQGELAEWMSREVGKPIAEAKGEVARCVVILRYYAGEAVRATGQVIPSQLEGRWQFSVRRPIGVVGLITPWNFPMAIPLWKAGPALASGNAVILKPSEHSPRCGELLAETALEAGLPAGVFQMVQGGGIVGEAMARNPHIGAVSFTGSVRTGKLLAAAAAERNLKLQTEMGGKNVAIVLEDADLDMAASQIAAGAFRFAGQKCTATSRVVVDRTVRDDLWEKLKVQTAQLKLGPVSDGDCAVGPVITATSAESVMSAIEACVCQERFSAPATGPDLEHGNFVSPTLLLEPAKTDSVWEDELFGPVLGVCAASGIEEALAIANATPFGLSAALYTRNIQAAMKFAESIHAGMIRINGDTTGVDPHAPFGGVGASSGGSREQGPVATDFYTEWRTVQVGPA